MPASVSWLVAHAGGWDEILLFGVPVVLALVAVRWAEKRAKERRNDGDEDDGRADDPRRVP